MKRVIRIGMASAAACGLALMLSLTGSGQALANSMKPLLMRDSDNPALRPFQTSLCFHADCDEGESNAFIVPTVSSTGEPVLRLVIEYVSSECGYTTTISISSFGLRTVADGVLATHRAVPVAVLNSFGYRMTSAQSTRLYADPGSEVLFFTDLAGPNTTCRMAVSGHLVTE